MSRRLAGVAALLLALAAPASPAQGPAGPADREATTTALIERWAGLHDSAEQLLVGDSGPGTLGADSSVRVSTLVVPVSLPWLGRDVLYFEEFPHDDPDSPRRVMLLRLEPQPDRGPGAVSVREFTFRSPARWRGLYAHPELAARLRLDDLETVGACDLTLVRDGDQFRGGTRGRGCIASTGAPEHYVDYRLLVGTDLYWYRRRVLRIDDSDLVQETVGFEWFELHRARLFACRIHSRARAQEAAAAPLAVVELHDQGGHARYTSPEGLAYELELHSNDWPFDANRDALILIVRELAADAPVASSWADLGVSEIAVRLETLEVRCGPLVASGAGTIF
jgi:hypothetical protein